MLLTVVALPSPKLAGRRHAFLVQYSSAGLALQREKYQTEVTICCCGLNA